MEKSINAFIQRLEQQSEGLKVNLFKLNDIFISQTAKQLNEQEQKINSIHFFRPIGLVDTCAIFYYAQSSELIIEIDTDLTRSVKNLTNETLEFESFILEEFSDENLEEFFIRCEQEYILWFSEIWHSSGCYLNNRIRYVLIENNSARSFDLNSMKWVKDAFENLHVEENFYFADTHSHRDQAMERIQLNYQS